MKNYIDFLKYKDILAYLVESHLVTLVYSFNVLDSNVFYLEFLHHIYMIGQSVCFPFSLSLLGTLHQC